jgi:peptidyl-tRNA hydrolase
LDLCEKENRINLETGEWKMIIFRYRGDGPWDQWLNGIFTKVVVSCDSESELLDLYQKSKDGIHAKSS